MGTFIYYDKYDDYLTQIEKNKKYDKLQNNWNELKKWLEETIKNYREKGWFVIANNLQDVLDKMQELEGNNE